MTFWFLTPKKLEIFIRAYKEKEKRELEKSNFISWLNGVYISHSIASVLGKNHKYPNEPLPLFQSEMQMEERNAKEAELFGAYAAMFNKQFEQKITEKEEG